MVKKKLLPTDKSFHGFFHFYIWYSNLEYFLDAAY